MFKLGNLATAAGALVLAGSGAASADSGTQDVTYGSPGVLFPHVAMRP